MVFFFLKLLLSTPKFRKMEEWGNRESSRFLYILPYESKKKLVKSNVLQEQNENRNVSSCLCKKIHVIMIAETQPQTLRPCFKVLVGYQK